MRRRRRSCGAGICWHISRWRRQPNMTCIHTSKSCRLDRLEYERDNFHTAFLTSQSCDCDPTLGLRLAVALWQYWLVRGHTREGRRWIELTLARGTAAAPAALRAWALLGEALLRRSHRGSFYNSGVELTTILREIEEALALFRTANDMSGTSRALCLIGAIIGSPFNPDANVKQGLALIEEAHRIASHQIKLPWMQVHTSMALATMANWMGEPSRAPALTRECHAAALHMGDAQLVATSLTVMMDASGALLDFHAAIAYGKEAVRVARELGNINSLHDALSQLSDDIPLHWRF